MFSFLKRQERPVKLKKFYHGDVFSIDAPAAWLQNASENNCLSVSAPFDAAAITGSSFQKEGGTLSEFARMRFSAVHECFTAIGPEQHRESNGLQMVLREYEGIWPGNRRTNLYLVAGIQLTEDVFVSLTITTTRKEYTKNRNICDEIINSVRKTGEEQLR